MRAIKRWEIPQSVSNNARIIAECVDGTFWIMHWSQFDNKYEWAQLPDIPPFELGTLVVKEGSTL